MKEGILSAKELASYIKYKYSIFTEGQKEITSIKMQKALYFCFALWAGFVTKGKKDGIIDKKVSEYLFTDKMEAWSYGPVVPDVYFNEKTLKLFNSKRNEEVALAEAERKLNAHFTLHETIDSILNDIFEISDFKLVSISHMDKSWQNHFHENDEKHNEEIPLEEIVYEYFTKKLA